MFKLICAVVPTTMLLTVSFFVLALIRKIEAQGLKAFGYVVAALLWVSALVIFSTGIYAISTGRPHLAGLKMMMGKCAMSCPMMQQKMDMAAKGMMGCPMMQKMQEAKESDMPGMKR